MALGIGTKIGEAYITVHVDRTQYDAEMRRLQTHGTAQVIGGTGGNATGTALAAGVGAGIGAIALRAMSESIPPIMEEVWEVNNDVFARVGIKRLVSNFKKAMANGMAQGLAVETAGSGIFVRTMFSMSKITQKIGSEFQNMYINSKNWVNLLRDGGIPHMRQVGRLVNLFAKNLHLAFIAMSMIGGFISYKLIKDFKVISDETTKMNKSFANIKTSLGNILINATQANMIFKAFSLISKGIEKSIGKMELYMGGLGREIVAAVLDFSHLGMAFRALGAFNPLEKFVKSLKEAKSLKFYGLEDAFKNMNTYAMSSVAAPTTTPLGGANGVGGTVVGFLKKIAENTLPTNYMGYGPGIIGSPFAPAR